MITSEICVTCVCLAICKHKNYTKTAMECAYVKNVFIQAALTIHFGNDVNIHFLGIDKTYFVNHDSCAISVGMGTDDDKRQKYYLFNYPHEHIVDADFNVKSYFPNI